MPTPDNHNAMPAQSGSLHDSALLAARILIAALLIIAAFNKFQAFAGIVAYFGKLGLPVPAITLPVVLVFETLAGLALIAGFQTRIAALAAGLFIIAAGLIAHNNFGDVNQLNHFLKNVGLLGGCLALFVAGAGRYSIDGRNG